MDDQSMRASIEEYQTKLQAARDNVASTIAAHITSMRLEAESRRRCEEDARSRQAALADRRRDEAENRLAVGAQRERTRSQAERQREEIMRKRASLDARQRQADTADLENIDGDSQNSSDDDCHDSACSNVGENEAHYDSSQCPQEPTGVSTAANSQGASAGGSPQQSGATSRYARCCMVTVVVVDFD